MVDDIASLRKLNFKLTFSDMRSFPVDDQIIVHKVTMIDELDKVINRLSMRLREWLAWAVPEARREITDNRKLSELVVEMNQKELQDDIHSRNPNLPESFGITLDEKEWSSIQSSSRMILSLFSHQDNITSSLEESMKETAPNTLAVAGSLVGAKLIAIAGSLKRLSEFPASTVQLLGAEKALFRHLKTGARCPKHGVILQHPLLAKAKRNMRGKTARMLADKISIASKVDYFKGEFVGDDLRKKLEAKL